MTHWINSNSCITSSINHIDSLVADAVMNGLVLYEFYINSWLSVH